MATIPGSGMLCLSAVSTVAFSSGRHCASETHTEPGSDNVWLAVGQFVRSTCPAAALDVPRGIGHVHRQGRHLHLGFGTVMASCYAIPLLRAVVAGAVVAFPVEATLSPSPTLRPLKTLRRVPIPISGRRQASTAGGIV